MTRTDTPTVVAVRPTELREEVERLTESLTRSGTLRSVQWRRAVEHTPRHPFVPRFWRLVPRASQHAPDTPPRELWERVDGRDPADREAWLAAVYDAGATLVTQLDGDDAAWDRPEVQVEGRPTSSSSLPRLVVTMLEDLDVRDGMRVLAVGTGTGYTTALLCARLGDRQVTSVDVDSGIVERARTRLAGCGSHPTLAVADGIDGYAANAPYDRIIATCSPARVPLSWLRQTRAGGKILVTLSDRRLVDGAQALLTVDKQHGAAGLFVTGRRTFMAMQSLQERRAPYAYPHPWGGQELRRELQERSPDDRRAACVGASVLDDPGFEFSLRLRLPALRCHWIRWVDLDRTEWWLLDSDGSWAHLLRDDERTVEQGGPRRLWDEIERLHQEWEALGSPPHDRFGLTATPDGGHSVWLDTPDSPHVWALG